MPVDAWSLAHAVRKADCARKTSPLFVEVGAIGFLVEQMHFFDWSHQGVNLATSMATVLADFSGTSLAGRVAQGVAVLQMEHQGYAFLERFESFLEHPGVAAGPGSMQGVGVSETRTPDFVFCANSGGVVLAESKGRFVAPAGDSHVKGKLREALEQLDAGCGMLACEPEGICALGTFLREIQDVTHGGSLLATVAERKTPSGRVPPCSATVVKQSNYAAWLRGMGLHQQARSLATLGELASSGQIELPTIRIGTQEYAFVATYARPGPVQGPLIGLPCEWPPPFQPTGRESFVGIMGVATPVLERLGACTGERSLGPLADLELPSPPETDASSEAPIRGSVLRDGTLLGELAWDWRDRLSTSPKVAQV
jgi:hypothetical protein